MGHPAFINSFLSPKHLQQQHNLININKSFKIYFHCKNVHRSQQMTTAIQVYNFMTSLDYKFVES